MDNLIGRWICFLVVGMAAMLAGGCASQGGDDPWEKSNRFWYSFDDGLDKYALKPLADGYVKVVWKPVRQCVTNGFNNLEYGNVILNDFLQGEAARGWSDAGRMFVNSTAGIGGVFDFASPLGLISHDTDFGITLGKWGCKQGPYMVLPLFGPSTVRDAPGIGVGILTDPLTWVSMRWYVSIPLNALEAVSDRAGYAKEFKFRNAVALDSYVFTRNAYLQHRQSQVDEGKTPTTGPSIFDEDEGAWTQPATQGAGPVTTAPATRPATQPAAGSPK